MTDEAPIKRRQGRPRLHPEGSRVSCTFRIPIYMRDQMRDVADKNGRSVSEEIEHRLAMSFRDVELVDALADRLASRLGQGKFIVGSEGVSLSVAGVRFPRA